MLRTFNKTLLRIILQYLIIPKFFLTRTISKESINIKYLGNASHFEQKNAFFSKNFNFN